MYRFEYTCEFCHAHCVEACNPSRPEHAEAWMCPPCYAEALGECAWCGAPHDLCGCYGNEGE